MSKKESLQYQNLAPVVGDLLVRDSFLDVTLGLTGIKGQWDMANAKKKLSYAVEQLLRAAKGQLQLAPPGLDWGEVRKGRDVYEFLGVTLDKVDPEAEREITRKWLQEHLRGFKTNFRRSAREFLARFPEGEPVDVPTYLKDHGNSEAAERWNEMRDLHGDRFKNQPEGAESANKEAKTMGAMEELTKLAIWEAGHRNDEEEIPEGEGSLVPGLEDRRGSTILAFIEPDDDMDESELVVIHDGILPGAVTAANAWSPPKITKSIAQQIVKKKGRTFLFDVLNDQITKRIPWQDGIRAAVINAVASGMNMRDVVDTQAQIKEWGASLSDKDLAQVRDWIDDIANKGKAKEERIKPEAWKKNARVRTAGWSFTPDRMYIALWGKRPFNRDVMDTIHHTPITFMDDDGDRRTDVVLRVIVHRTGPSLTHVQEKQGMEQETVLQLSIPEGSERSVEMALRKELRQFKLEVLPSFREPGVRQKDKLIMRDRRAGQLSGPGIPDGTGPWGGTPQCPMSDDEIESDEVGPGGHVPDGTGPHGRGMGPGQGRGDRFGGSLSGPGIPDGTGPWGGTPRCPMSDEDGGPGDEMVGRFEEGKPADPCENMTDAECAEWKANTEKYKDKFDKEAKVSPKSRTGTRVVIQVNPAARMLYRGLPPNGTAGSVYPVAGPGGHMTYMPGPGGGLLYVKFDDGTFMGVSPNDLMPESSRMAMDDLEKLAGRKPKGRGDFALVQARGMDDLVLSLHPTKAEAENAMRKHGGEPNSLFTNGLRVVDVGPHGGSELIDIFGKWTIRPKRASAMDDLEKLAGVEKEAISQETADFVEWAINQTPMTRNETIRMLKVAGLKEILPPRTSRPGPRFQQGDNVLIKAEKHPKGSDTYPIYQENDGKVGKVVGIEGEGAYVQFKTGQPVSFPDAQKKGVGIYKYTPAFVMEGSKKLELIYESGGKVNPDRVFVVEQYLGRGKSVKRKAPYLTGHAFNARYNKSGGVYFTMFPQQRMAGGSEAGFEATSINPEVGKLYYMGLMGKRPSSWQDELAAMQAGGMAMAASAQLERMSSSTMPGDAVSEAERFAEGGDEKDAMFEKGKPADPCENMSDAECKEWKANTEKYKDKFAKDGDELLGRFEEGKPADPCENLSESECEEFKANTEKYKDKFKAEKEAAVSDVSERAFTWFREVAETFEKMPWSKALDGLGKAISNKERAENVLDDFTDLDKSKLNALLSAEGEKKLKDWLKSTLKKYGSENEAPVRERLTQKQARPQMLLPKDIRRKIPKLYSQENTPDPIAWVKFFNPYGRGTWLITEFDGRDTMFGLADLGFPELGYVSLGELESLEKMPGLQQIERDISFRPMPLSQAAKKNGINWKPPRRASKREGAEKNWIHKDPEKGDKHAARKHEVGDVVDYGGKPHIVKQVHEKTPRSEGKGPWPKYTLDPKNGRGGYVATPLVTDPLYKGPWKGKEAAVERERMTQRTAAREPSGMYGFTKRIQADCEAASRRLAKAAVDTARRIYAKDQRVSQFLSTHAERSDSLSAKILVMAMQEMGPKFASEIKKQARLAELRAERGVEAASTKAEPQDKTAKAKYGLYGFRAKTASLGLGACNTIREEAGNIASDLHSRRADKHAAITEFLRNRSKRGRCLYSRMLVRSYPNVDTKIASVKPSSVNEWLAWEE